MSLSAECDPLFAPRGGGERVWMRLLRKAGRPFLLLPESPRCARHVLSLYPAQKRLARMWRWGLRWVASVGVPIGKMVDLRWERDAPVPLYFSTRAGTAHPAFGLLFGNPNASGRRLLAVVLRDGEPEFVAKLGLGEAAARLLEREASCLEGLPADLPGRPPGFERISGTTGFALAFVPGRSPTAAVPEGKLVEVLSAWIDRQNPIRLTGIPAWMRVRSSKADAGAIRAIESAFEGHEFFPAISHGDFAPWNVREFGGGCTVLDWERGERVGMPGWDWLHYVIQTQVLVARRSAAEVVRRARQAMEEPAFQAYAETARVRGREGALLKSYLLHACEVVGQTEGAEVMRGALALT